tara:strand:+ start:2620 stop:3018 length:399 start_codon:yes stop_codon:yes gene_type:complete
MAITLPVYQPTNAVSVATASGGAETTSAVRMTHSAVSNHNITRGALTGLSLHITTWGSGTETITVRVYRASDKTDLILETDAAFTAANDRAYIQPDLPVPFFDGVWVTIQSDTGAVETCNIKPDVMGIAGNS